MCEELSARGVSLVPPSSSSSPRKTSALPAHHAEGLDVAKPGHRARAAGPAAAPAAAAATLPRHQWHERQHVGFSFGLPPKQQQAVLAITARHVGEGAQGRGLGAAQRHAQREEQLRLVRLQQQRRAGCVWKARGGRCAAGRGTRLCHPPTQPHGSSSGSSGGSSSPHLAALQRGCPRPAHSRHHTPQQSSWRARPPSRRRWAWRARPPPPPLRKGPAPPCARGQGRAVVCAQGGLGGWVGAPAGTSSRDGWRAGALMEQTHRPTLPPTHPPEVPNERPRVPVHHQQQRARGVARRDSHSHHRPPRVEHLWQHCCVCGGGGVGGEEGGRGRVREGGGRRAGGQERQVCCSTPLGTCKPPPPPPPPPPPHTHPSTPW